MFAVLLVSRSGTALTGVPADDAFLDAFVRNALVGCIFATRLPLIAVVCSGTHLRWRNPESPPRSET